MKNQLTDVLKSTNQKSTDKIVHRPSSNRSSTIVFRPTPEHQVNDIDGYFDEGKYIAATKLRPGEDAYKRNKFNQAATDALPSNRAVPDTRNKK